MEVHNSPPPPLKCHILGFGGLIVQGILGLISLSALLVKRYFEKPKRPWVVWIFDNSKQVFGAFLQHCLNMMLAILLSHTNEADNCDWYFINFICDILIGVPLCYLGLKMVENIGLKYHIEELNTGVYIKELHYSPDIEFLDPAILAKKHEVDYKIWIIQIAVWGLIVASMKVLLFCILQIFAVPLEIAVKVCLGWLNIYPNIKLVLIMMVVPLVCNALQFWIQDGILKAKKEINYRFSLMERCKSVMYDKNFRFEDRKKGKRSSSFKAKKEPFVEL
ncbi:unnamed protein product [Moneuplotes crassus]|uniref:Uncharacterized protein n=1 Tax=Euplotes crassus TaxID=5936 RepID=A0AAD2D252_EUPCR|nr:unnamed protein product [Moneuplotes crassus]